ncbi:MAG: lysozyme, partial [Erysipelotrichia bacterium]|nr:lysozyme [Erysipelotrichia bacterium]
NAEQWDLAAVEIKRWNKAGGKVLKGLDNRRKDEAKWLLMEA